MADTEHAVQRLRELKALGVRLALDDFGTGYSSLSYLSSFPVDILKMDRSFLTRATRRPRPPTSPTPSSRSAPRSTSRSSPRGSSCRSSGTALRELGCDLGQGYLFRPPMDVDATLAFLARGRAGRRARCCIATRRWTAPAASPAAGCSRRCATATSACCGAGSASRCWATARSSSRSPGRSTRCRTRATAMSIVGIAMTVPTIVFLLVGGVASDRLDRRRIMLARRRRARVRGRRCSRVLVAHRRARAVARRRARRLLRHRRGVLRARLRRDRAGAAPGRAARAGQRARADRAAARAAARRARARRRRWSGRSAPAPRSRSTPRRSSSPPPPLLAMRRGARAPVPPACPWSATCARAGATCAAAPGCGRRSPARRSPTCCFMGPVEVLLPLLVKNELGGSATDLGLVFAAGGLGSVGLRGADRPARAPAARHHVHVRRLDARDAGRRRLRRGGRRSGS